MIRKIVAFAAGILLALPTSAWAAWHEAKSRHFIIYSEQSGPELKEFATRLEKFDAAVRFARGMPDPPLGDSGKLTVYVLRDRESVAKMLGNPDLGVAGYYLADISGARTYVYRKRGEGADYGLTPEVVFFHEYFHHLMLAHTDAVMPHWVVEGFAEFFSTARIDPDGSVLLGRPADHRALSLFLLSDLSLQRMVGNSYKELSGGEVQRLYGRGWLLTHYLNFEPSRQGQLTRYLQLIQQGQSGLAAAQSAFGDLGRLGRELEAYIKRKTLPGIRVPADKLRTGPIAVRMLPAPEAAVMSVRLRLDRRTNMRPSEGERIAEDARRIAARFPADPVVQSTLAETELIAGRPAPALAAADRTLAINPNHLAALTLKARAQMKLAEAAPRSADWKATRALLLRANKIEPENPEPLMLFYQTFTAAGEKPTANATAALLYARALMPQDDKLRLHAVRQLLNDSKLAEARAAIAPMAFDPHTKHHELALKVLTAIAAGNRSAALVALDELTAKRKKDEE